MKKKKKEEKGIGEILKWRQIFTDISSNLQKEIAFLLLWACNWFLHPLIRSYVGKKERGEENSMKSCSEWRLHQIVFSLFVKYACILRHVRWHMSYVFFHVLHAITTFCYVFLPLPSLLAMTSTMFYDKGNLIEDLRRSWCQHFRSFIPGIPEPCFLTIKKDFPS